MHSIAAQKGSKILTVGSTALALASSGIVATLLDGGRTARPALKLPLNILQLCHIIVWDECTMAHKYALEALNRTLKDLRRNDILFGGALLSLPGDFRQTLPIIPRSTNADEINACLKSSSLWRNIQTLKFKTNTRIRLQYDLSAERFAKQLLDIGNGKMYYIDNTQSITLPNDFCTITTA
ncbi:hypothetical protein PR048_007445 [Dryococelus australis]|uniref:ATP-dependent DNA helicase n=1 Tax=Dryococelus australis TaxID=614101 RepID=A0ABQ9HV61_9NEOP|nr:hypothetical protein PR048_007445 [Dryococelus australis]